MKQPSHEQASAHAEVVTDQGQKGYCCYYPQMGGYTGIAVVVPTGDCFDVLVWHDGDFPFGDVGDDDGQEPTLLHHCDADQFVSFGNQMKEFQARSSNG